MYTLTATSPLSPYPIQETLKAIELTHSGDDANCGEETMTNSPQ